MLGRPLIAVPVFITVSRVVIDLIGDHRAHNRDVVYEFRMIGQEVADPLTTLAVFLELGKVPLNLEFRAEAERSADP